jgi:hypothetical protein
MRSETGRAGSRHPLLALELGIARHCAMLEVLERFERAAEHPVISSSPLA